MKVRLKKIKNPDRFYKFFLEGDSLKREKIYEVIEIQNQHYRIENEYKEPILYDKRLFDMVDATIPKDYVYLFNYQDVDYIHEDEDGWMTRDFIEEYNITPLCFSQRNFFDLYFEGYSDKIEIYNNYIKNR